MTARLLVLRLSRLSSTASGTAQRGQGFRFVRWGGLNCWSLAGKKAACEWGQGRPRAGPRQGARGRATAPFASAPGVQPSTRVAGAAGRARGAAARLVPPWCSQARGVARMPPELSELAAPSLLICRSAIGHCRVGAPASISHSRPAFRRRSPATTWRSLQGGRARVALQEVCACCQPACIGATS